MINQQTTLILNTTHQIKAGFDRFLQQRKFQHNYLTNQLDQRYQISSAFKRLITL